MVSAAAWAEFEEFLCYTLSIGIGYLIWLFFFKVNDNEGPYLTRAAKQLPPSIPTPSPQWIKEARQRYNHTLARMQTDTSSLSSSSSSTEKKNDNKEATAGSDATTVATESGKKGKGKSKGKGSNTTTTVVHVEPIQPTNNALEKKANDIADDTSATPLCLFADSGKNGSKKRGIIVASETLPLITLSTLADHNGRTNNDGSVQSIYVAIKGEVFDVSSAADLYEPSGVNAKLAGMYPFHRYVRDHDA
jgi:hypothetical protein